MEDLTGQVAIVTGGGRGIGRAMAEALAVAGAVVVVTARSADELDAAVAAITTAGGRALAAPGDVTRAGDVGRVLEQAERRFGPVTLLVHAAGANPPVGPLWENDPDAWWGVLESHLKGMYLWCRAVLPGMVARRRGRIITVVSIAAYSPVGGYLSSYAAAKAAQVRLTQVLANEGRPHEVHAFAIHPGVVRTDMTAEVGTDSPLGQAFDRWLPGLVRVFAQQAEVPATRAADLCVYLASGRADALTGRLFDVTLVDAPNLEQQAARILDEDLYAVRYRTPAT
jgi:NAD(P)-dependent dehydrogenase (short-subunit alcohol dehydrogenase family)